eukprot:gene13231-10311_t
MVLTIFVVIGLPMLGCYAITHATYYLQQTKVQYLMDTEEYQKKLKKFKKEYKLNNEVTNIEMKEIDFESKDEIEFETNISDKSLGNRIMNLIGLGSKIRDNDSNSKLKNESKLKKFFNFIIFISGFKYSQKKWRLAMVASSSGINGIFDAYNFWFRYWGIWKFIEKFLLAIVVLFFFPFGSISSGIGLGISLIIHSITITLTIIFRPYNAMVSNILSIFCSICLILSTLYIFISSIIPLP